MFHVHIHKNARIYTYMLLHATRAAGRTIVATFVAVTTLDTVRQEVVHEFSELTGRASFTLLAVVALVRMARSWQLGLCEHVFRCSTLLLHLNFGIGAPVVHVIPFQCNAICTLGVALCFSIDLSCNHGDAVATCVAATAIYTLAKPTVVDVPVA